MFKNVRSVLRPLVGALALSCLAMPALAADFYAGKQITLIAGAAGGWRAARLSPASALRDLG